MQTALESELALVWTSVSLFHWLFAYLETLHRSSRSSISLSGCAAPRLHWGRWGRPCPPLYWSVGGSSSAPPPWTKWCASGCPSAQPPPRRRAPLGYWPTEGSGRIRVNKDGGRWKQHCGEILEYISTLMIPASASVLTASKKAADYPGQLEYSAYK